MKLARDKLLNKESTGGTKVLTQINVCRGRALASCSSRMYKSYRSNKSLSHEKRERGNVLTQCVTR